MPSSPAAAAFKCHFVNLGRKSNVQQAVLCCTKIYLQLQVAMDEQGMIPEALRRVLQSAGRVRTGARRGKGLELIEGVALAF
jgi:hypothetical protein